MTLIQLHRPAITWEILPADFILPDDPVENNLQPLLAAALRESLELAGLILIADVIATNFGLCAKVADKTVVKAPDWLWIRDVPGLDSQIRRSYTPHAEGPVPLIVMEFISETEGQEYSLNPHYPYGKWYFYEQILQVPIYVIFHPYTGELDVYCLQENSYHLQITDEYGRYWLPEIGLFLGVWQGSRGQINANWLRWWDSSGNLLLWGKELVEQEQQRVIQEYQRAEQERQRAEQEHQRAEQVTSDLEQERSTRQLLEAKLRELGFDPGQLS
ncbi:MAG: hypothetical protein HC916_10935 [Coleofasciculaceae cyanobacterium SM2_1_6]|nr:hypothetical protein [Coleofasciculaceae cyanobacterium SM2_1_6]